MEWIDFSHHGGEQSAIVLPMIWRGQQSCCQIVTAQHAFELRSDEKVSLVCDVVKNIQ